MSGDDWYPEDSPSGEFDSLARDLARVQASLRESVGDRQRLLAVIRETLAEIEDTVDCDLRGESWHCTVTYSEEMVRRLKQALAARA